MKKQSRFYIRSSQEFKDKYIDFCKRNRYVFAKRVRALMEMDMEDGLKKEKKLK